MKEVIKTLLIYFLVFLIFFAFFWNLQFSFSNLAGRDGYYHIKQAWLIRTQGIEMAVGEFPWMQCSIFKENPGDLWFGYHLLLYPFTFGDLIFGAKLSSVLFSAIFFLGLFWLLRRLKVKYPLFWVILPLLMGYYFIFRLLLPRPYIFSILFSLIGFYLIFHKRYLGIFILSFFYTLITTEAPLIIFIAFCLMVLEWLKKKIIDLRSLALTVAGFLVGLLLKPDFPHNFYLIFHQIFSVLYLRFSGLNLNFGAELSCAFGGLVKDNPVLFLAFVLPLWWLIIQFVQKKHRPFPLLYLSLMFFSFFFAFLSFVSGRFIEYWIPFTLLLVAVWFNSLFLPALSKMIKDIKEFKGYQLDFFHKKIGYFYRKAYNIIRIVIFKFDKKFFKYSALSLIFALTIWFVFYQFIVFPFGIINTNPLFLSLFKEGASWLRENTPPGSVVLNYPWHTFPPLFFYNHQNFYCNGMDPTFMYVKSPENYWTWLNLLSGGIICDREICSGEDQKINEKDNKEITYFLKEKLGGNYIFLDNANQKFIQFLNSSENFEKVFEKGKIEIYKIN